jgi:hypothetical protein
MFKIVDKLLWQLPLQASCTQHGAQLLNFGGCGLSLQRC